MDKGGASRGAITLHSKIWSLSSWSLVLPLKAGGAEAVQSRESSLGRCFSSMCLSSLLSFISTSQSKKSSVDSGRLAESSSCEDQLLWWGAPHSPRSERARVLLGPSLPISYRSSHHLLLQPCQFPVHMGS